MPEAHLLVAGGGAEQRMARLEGEALFKLVAGQLDLVLIVIDAGAVVVEDGRAGRVELEGAAEVRERFVVHAVAAQRDAGNHVDVPVVGRGGEQVGDPMAGRLFFAARKQHVNAVEIGLGGSGVELEGFVEGAARAHHVNLAAKAVARILQLGDAEAGPRGGKARIGGGDTGKQSMGVVKVGTRPGAHHERAEQERGPGDIFR